jgi:hypothetical protein
MRLKVLLAATALAAPVALAQPALAKVGDPVKVGPEFTIDPILDARLRWESVDTPTTNADAVTMRFRSGLEFKHLPSRLALLVEAEATLGIVDDYNAFPGGLNLSNPPVGQFRPGFAVVADPENIELNRLQLQYKDKATTVTVGRQRINLDDQRWVGAVGWRQNEQTFDAARGEVKIGPILLDATYAISQRTIFGYDAGNRAAYDGHFGFLGTGAKLGPVQVKAFAYLLDYDTGEQVGGVIKGIADSQTYGLRATASFKLTPDLGLALMASYARQSAWQDNDLDFAADYIAAEGSLSFAGFALTAGYEKLGSDPVAGGRRAVQTPMATLHKFNGWADLFLVTPDNGLQDVYVGLSYKFPAIKALPGLNAQVVWHTYDSDIGGIDYGSEWNASLGFKLGPVGLLAKYATYQADLFGADTEKFWLQAEYAF